MKHFAWRRFRSFHPPVSCAGAPELYGKAEVLVREYVGDERKRWRKRDVKVFDGAVASLQHKAEMSGDPVDWVATVIVQSPRAAYAQKIMDSRGGGYYNRQARLFELIDFNDAYVSAVLSLPDAATEDFSLWLKRCIDRFCKRTGYAGFSDEEWEAITHGLSREIAVFKTAQKAGFHVRMTSRREDAMGVDMIVTDPDTSKSINLDVKTRSSFHFRLIDLQREGRISEEARMHAELSGYLFVMNGHGSERVRTTLLRVDHETYGEIEDFAITKSDLFVERLKEIILAS